MKILIRQARIIDAQSPFHNQVVDLLISDGIIEQISAYLVTPEHAKEVLLDNLHLSQGWFDSSVSLGEPGFEDRENIENGLRTAALSGFTAVAVQPNTHPVVDNQSHIQLLINKSRNAATQLFPIGALTKKSEGNDMAELFDMKSAGAVAFGDYNKSLEKGNLLKIALQYVQDFDGLVIAFAQDQSLSGNGVANEGPAAMKLGLKGIPALAEEIQLSRNLSILEYSGGKMHVPTISTAQSVQLIREAKQKGLQVSCSVAVHHLILTDEALAEFDTRYKVIPPLRSESDRTALLQAVTDGTIDMITSDHNPIDIEQKKMEFDLAAHGTIGLESAFTSLMTVLPLETVITKLTAGKVHFGILNHRIDAGEMANLTLFRPDGIWAFTKSNIHSKSKNSAFLGEKQVGKVYGIYNQRQLILNQ